MSQTKVEAPFVENNRPFRNLLINGDMAIAQRATSATTAGNGTYKTLDKIQTYNATDGAYTTAQTALSAADQATTGQYFSLDIQCTTADTSIGSSQYAFIVNKIEAQTLQPLKFGTSEAQPITLSFYIKSNLTGTTCGFISKEDSTFTMCPFEFTINSANTWEKKVVTIPVNAVIQTSASAVTYDNGVGMTVGINLAIGSDLDNGTNVTWEATTAGYATSNQLNFLSSTDNDMFITGMQLEVGSDATDFEYLPHDVNLARCERYLQKWLADDTYDSIANGAAWNNTTFICEYRFCSQMRVEPTLTTNGTFIASMTGNDRSASSITLNRTTKENIQIVMTIPNNTEIGKPGFFRDGNDGDTYLLFHADM